jgi:hypothetical protein
MRLNQFAVAIGTAAVAAAFASSPAAASAPAAAAPAASTSPSNAIPPATGAPAGTKFVKVEVDGYYYHLPEGSKNNMDAVRVLVNASNGMGMSRITTWVNDITEGDGSRSCLGCATDSFEYRGSGMFDGKQAKLVSLKFDYRFPAIRTDVTLADGSRTVTVAKQNVTWDESTPGTFKAASKQPAAERLLPAMLLPPAAVVYGAYAADKIKVAKSADGTAVLTLPVPALGTDMKATVDGNGRVVHTELTYGGKVYSGDYSDFTNDKMDYHVFGPHKVVQKVDGKVVTDLTLEYHWTNPYLVFPTPKELAAK